MGRVVANIPLSLDGRVNGRGGDYDMGLIAPHAVTDEPRLPVMPAGRVRRFASRCTPSGDVRKRSKDSHNRQRRYDLRRLQLHARPPLASEMPSISD